MKAAATGPGKAAAAATAAGRGGGGAVRRGVAAAAAAAAGGWRIRLPGSRVVSSGPPFWVLVLGPDPTATTSGVVVAVILSFHRHKLSQTSPFYGLFLWWALNIPSSLGRVRKSQTTQDTNLRKRFLLAGVKLYFLKVQTLN